MNKKTPYSIEVKIEDSKGRTVFKWHKSQNNLLSGLRITNDFVRDKLGIDETDKRETKSRPDSYIKRPQIAQIRKEERNVNTFIAHAFGSCKPVEPIFGLKKGGERERK